MQRMNYRYRVRRNVRRNGIVWRWFVFEGATGVTLDGGIILDADRDKAETAAKAPIERRRQPAAAPEMG